MPEIRNERERAKVFTLFRSPAVVQGEELLFDCVTSARLHKQAVRRGFTDEGGRLRGSLSPLERMVMRLRASSVGEPYNHEWWAEWASSPAWFKRLHEVILESWVFYPSEDGVLDPQQMGQKIGYEFEYQRRKFEKAAEDAQFVERWQLAEFGPPQMPDLPDEWKKEKVVFKYPIDGFDDWSEYAKDRLEKLNRLRRKIALLASELGAGRVAFDKGMAVGGENAQEVDLELALIGRDEREQVLHILEWNFDLIAQLPNRREIADFIVARLPAERQAFLKNEAQRHAFIERLRHTYFGKIDLSPAARGMPRKSEKITPRRSRILIYTPDIASGREDKSS